MAPNLVKSSSQLSLDLSNHITFGLEPPVSVYPPLTDNDALSYDDDRATTNGSIFASPVRKNSLPSSFLFNLMVKEEAHRAVSCAQIEANLITDAHREASSQEDIIVNNNKEEEDSYWDMPSDCDNVQEEMNVVSTGQVERLLVEDALRRIEEAEKQQSDKGAVVVNKHPNNAYWDWPSEPVLESEKKASLIVSILLEESIREKLSIDSITNHEFANKRDVVSEAPHVEVSSENVSSADYWYWNSEEESKHEEIVAPHVHDPTHPNHAYWDFPNEPTNEVELKEKLITKILNEERIRNLLSSEATEEREVNFHRSRNHNEDDKSKETCYYYYSASESELNAMPENYWDFNASTEGDLISLLSKEKQALINRILKEEQLRYIVSTANIENHLVDASMESGKGQEEHVENTSISTSYWDW